MTSKIPPVQMGQKYTVPVVGLGSSGEGVAKYNEFTIFIPNALPAEQVEVKITQVKKNYAKGVLTNIITPSAMRTQPRCDLYESCGGCQLQHASYQSQLELKRQIVVDAVTRIAKIPDVTIYPAIGDAEGWYYRNKMQFPVGVSKGNLAIGCYAQGSHNIIDTQHCYIQHELNNVIVNKVRAILTKLHISAYDETTGSGIVRHILGRVGTATGEVMVVLVTATKELPQQARIIEELRAAIPNLVSVVHNINSKKTNVILGNITMTLWGKDTIDDCIGDFRFKISARSFFQVNTKQAHTLYSKAVEYAGLTGNETVIDAYCGTGTVTLFLAQAAAKVYGIEIVEPAIADAKDNARHNQVNNVEFIAADAVDIMPKLYKQGVRPQVVVVDPPRAGCDPKVLETFVAMNPERIVYISCNPASLARDLGLLAEHGYVTAKIQPVDMFPQTFHVECVALIERK